MEAGRRKRKMANEEEKEDENEDEKMEKFFALIESTREVRDLLKRSNCNNGNGSEEKQRKKVDDDQKDKATGAWNPTFQPEDFLGDIHHDHNINIPGGAVTLAGPSKRH
ncbi:hypothetical protein FNV43_RR05827 [Rhamnella rubrinervis]|uniref:Uncharacterized protein n=1 Tax=Rhamnella rubrinervis TaxID=2594499 RepID=A0A8K0MQT1_9ROSA|nr:hypothetical protein FNV43_RR05827 [Rhamnella rubrinervis]